MGLVVITIVVIGLLMAGMAVGVIVRGRVLRGSCGGVAVRGPDGESLTCGNCGCEPAEQIEAPREAATH